MWDANKIEVAALLKKNEKQVGFLPMQYAGVPSQFSATWSVKAAGVYEAIVYAYDPANGNTGVDKVRFRVR